MNTVNSLKRPSTVPIDPLKLLACKTCEKDDGVLNVKTCGCLLCKACDGDTPDKCISCNSEIDPKIKLSFSKNPRCKFYELNQCFGNAEYKCKCIQSPVCSSCLTSFHGKRMRGSCIPEILLTKTPSNHKPCELCKDFIAEFKMVSEPFTKICLYCKINKKVICTPYKTDSDWNQFYTNLEQSSQMTSDKIKKLKEALESSSLVREQAIQKCRDAIPEIQKCLNEYTEQFARQVVTLKQQLNNFNKISIILKPDGKVKTILDLLKNEQLTLQGAEGKEQITAFLKYYREKNNYNPFVEQIKRFVVQNSSRRQHLLQFPLPSSPNAGVPVKSNVSVQEIIDNEVKPFFILVEMHYTPNEREKILDDIEKHQDKWVRKESFTVNTKVIIYDADAITSPRYKRAKILKRGDNTSKVFLLDFGFEMTVENGSIGEIKEINIDGKKSCFLAQLTGSVNVKCGLQQESWLSSISHLLPKAQHLHITD